MLRALMSSAVGMLLVACSSATPTAPRPENARLLPGVGSFGLGYHHGCLSGKVWRSVLYNRLERDPYLYRHDERYRAGWNIGVRECG